MKVIFETRVMNAFAQGTLSARDPTLEKILTFSGCSSWPDE
jgi:hypothetical protein